MIRASGLRRAFAGRVAVDGVDIDVAGGEVVGLMGPNGAGKSTTFRLLLGLLAPDGGTASVTRPVGHLPEGYRPPAALDVRQVLRVAATAKGLRATDRETEVARVVDLLDLGTVTRRPMGRLSHGQRQRVGLAQAFLGRPATLLLDEPTSGLDPAQVVDLRRSIRRAAEDTGAAVLVASHAAAEVAATCDRVVVLAAGRVRAEVPVTTAAALEQAWITAVDGDGGTP